MRLNKNTARRAAAAAALLTYNGSMELPTMLMLDMFSFMIFGSVEAMNNAAHVLEVIDATLDKLDGIEHAEMIDKDGEDISLQNTDIAFRDVTFSYDKVPVLRNISFSIPQGSTTAIVGPSGSGKTTITKKLMQRFGSDVSVIYHDNYYKAHHDMPYEQRALLNYDHPDAFDTGLLIEAVKKLKKGQGVCCPVYDYSIHDRTDRTIAVNPAKVIIVEGILIFQSRELCREMDVKIYVDTDADVRILRRIVRDVRDRGRSLESVVSQYLTTVKPMHEQFVEPSKRNADIIIPEGGHNQVAMEMLMERVRAHIEKESGEK